MNVEFNPEYVRNYRLIGFDNKVGALRDTSSIIEGGEIGSGYSMMAIFEIVPSEINKGAIKDNFTRGKFADLKLNYHLPSDKKKDWSFNHTSHFEYMPFEDLDKCYQFSAAVVMFGGLLRTSAFVKNIGWNEILTIAETSSRGTDLLQKEFIALVQQAKALYTKVKKKKGSSNRVN
jgi:Ca-activated chloride channel family protein